MSLQSMIHIFACLDELTIQDDVVALEELSKLLECNDPWILLKKEGPRLLARLRHFGLLAPHTGGNRLDHLDPELVCRTLVLFEKWKLSVLNLNQAKDFLSKLDFAY